MLKVTMLIINCLTLCLSFILMSENLKCFKNSYLKYGPLFKD